MTEDRKILEQSYYDRKEYKISDINFSVDFNNISLRDKIMFPAIVYYDKLINSELLNRKKGNILDYGCGTGNEHYKYCSDNIHIIGIDISDKSIKIANQNAEKYKLNAEYLKMDCENMNFQDNTFDVILDFGTLSSLDIKKAIPEIIRVMRPNGTLICIETLGHNFFMNLKRKINVLIGKRTDWSASHIMKEKDWNFISSLFENFRIEYFAFSTLFLYPILKILPKSVHYKMIIFFDVIDRIILKIFFFRKFAFKTVIILNKPKK